LPGRQQRLNAKLRYEPARADGGFAGRGCCLRYCLAKLSRKLQGAHLVGWYEKQSRVHAIRAGCRRRWQLCGLGRRSSLPDGREGLRLHRRRPVLLSLPVSYYLLN
jgi:hypothetical protein